jgi:hypothetical protein
VSRAERLETIDDCWVAARDLAEGDAVRTMSSQGVAGTATITKIGSRHAVIPVYNLTVRGTSRYLVGGCGVVVHNKGGEGAVTAWPPNNGFHYGIASRRSLPSGHLIDRFGPESGRFASPVGTPYAARSLRPGVVPPYHRYEVLRPIEVWEGTATPWFNQPGGGIQYELPMSVRQLVERGCLREIIP